MPDVPLAAGEPRSSAPPATPARQSHRLHFSGTGQEYFRIWIVNLLLTALTLGVYSAWAKVRRIQYFYRNTQLDGAVFAFDGKPAAILRGRLLALVLLGLYQYAFGFSVAFGVAIVTGLILALPCMMRAALRFRLGATRWRGLRFHFSGSTRGAYLAYGPMFAIFLVPAALAALAPASVAFVPLSYLAWPLIYGTMKRYQHGNVSYAGLHSHCALGNGSFYGNFLLVALVAVVAGIVAAVLIGIGSGLARDVATYGGAVLKTASVVMPLAGAVLALYLVYLVAVPWLQVKLGNRILNATSFDGVTLVSDMRTWPFVKLQTVNALLTLATLGLYRPFAVVKVYRYRLAHLALAVDPDVEARLQQVQAAPTDARGDGAADFLGTDLSW